MGRCPRLQRRGLRLHGEPARAELVPHGRVGQTLNAPLPYALIAALVLGHVAFAGSRFTLTLHAVALGASPFAIGLILGLMMAMPMLLVVHIGRYSDRHGYGMPASVGLALQLAGSLIVAAWPAMPALYIASILTGTGYMSAHVAVNNAIGQVTAVGRTTQAFSVVAMGFSLSGLTGPMIAGVTIDHLGHAAAFLILAVFTGTSLAVLQSARRTYVLRPAPAALHRDARVFDLLRDKRLRAVFIATGMIAMGWDLFNFLAPLQGVRAGLSATAIGLLVGSFCLGTFAIRLVLPRLASGVGQWGTMAGALFVTALGYMVFPLLHGFAWLAVASFVLGMSLGGGQPMSMTLLHRSSPAGRAGEAVGIRSMITSASQTALPIVFGALGTALGVVFGYWLMSAMLVAGAVFAMRQRRADRDAAATMQTATPPQAETPPG